MKLKTRVEYLLNKYQCWTHFNATDAATVSKNDVEFRAVKPRIFVLLKTDLSFFPAPEFALPTAVSYIDFCILDAFALPGIQSLE